MLNIKKQGSSLLITSSDNSQFPWVDGEMSLPMNSITYVVDESNYITFRSAANNDILFTALIDEIQINGSNVTKEDLILTFDSVANSASSGGNVDTSNLITNVAIMGGDRIVAIQGSGNVLSEIYFPTINNQQILGVEGNITIEGGSGSGSGSEYTAGDGISIADNTITNNGVTSINIGESLDESFQSTGDVKIYTNFYDGSYDVNVNGTTFYGLKPIDDTITIENAGGTANGNFRCGIKVNEWNGTQSEYDALGTYDSGCTYNIIEG